jgi:hypothetical protein
VLKQKDVKQMGIKQCLGVFKIALLGNRSIGQSFSVLLPGVVNVFTTTPLWVVNTRLKMKGLGSRTGRGSVEHVADQYGGLIGMTVAGDTV